MEKKYEFTDETIKVITDYEAENVENKKCTLHRIRALKDFSNGFFKVKKGDLGGFIEKESNLSHEGTCWVYNDAMVYENAEVSGNGGIYENAEVYGNAKVYENAEVRSDAIVDDYAKVYGNARVYGDALVCDNAQVYGNAEVKGRAEVRNEAQVFGKALVFGNAEVGYFAKVYGEAMIYGEAKITGKAEISKGKISEERIDGSKKSIIKEQIMPEKKYELTDETKKIDGQTWHRIKALKDFADVKKGELGGFIEKEDNLSQEGNCWVYGVAEISGNAVVKEDARIKGHSKVISSEIYGSAEVSGYASVIDSHVSDSSKICGDAKVCDSSVSGNAVIKDDARVRVSSFSGNAEISGEAVAFYDVKASGDVKISEGKYFCGEFINGKFITAGNREVPKKYELTDETIEVRGHTLHRIRALREFTTNNYQSNVEKGELGGFVESEDNLSQNDYSWLFDNAKSYGNARVTDGAYATDEAEICDNASLSQYAEMHGSAVLRGNARVYGNANVWGNAEINDNASVCDFAEVNENACLYDNAKVYGHAEITDDATVSQNARVYEGALVKNMSCVSEDARVCGRAEITECSQVLGNSYVDEGRIKGTANYYGDTTLNRKKKNGMEME